MHIKDNLCLHKDRSGKQLITKKYIFWLKKNNTNTTKVFKCTRNRSQIYVLKVLTGQIAYEWREKWIKNSLLIGEKNTLVLLTHGNMYMKKKAVESWQVFVTLLSVILWKATKYGNFVNTMTSRWSHIHHVFTEHFHNTIIKIKSIKFFIKKTLNLI